MIQKIPKVALNIYTSNSDKLDKELQKDCKECPLDEYKNPIATANQIDKNELPILAGTKRKAQKAVDEYSKELNRIQTEYWNQTHSSNEQVKKLSKN
jgi:hypothetical protein